MVPRIRLLTLSLLLVTLAGSPMAQTAPQFRTIYNFHGAHGVGPSTGVVIAGGALYGATGSGGSHDFGVVYSLTPPSSPGAPWTETVLYNFTGGNDGSSPTTLTIGLGGILYGTTNNLSSAGVGTVFSLTPPAAAAGAWTYALVHGFSGPDGGDPQGVVVQNRNGAIYGTTSSGGAADLGVVFRLDPPASPASAWKETVLYSFSGSDGAYPYAGVAIGKGEVLYGTTTAGAGTGYGNIYSLAPPSSAGNGWTFNSLYAFTGPDGNTPYSGVTLGKGGVLYGTTLVGGTSDDGVVYSLTPPAAPGGSWTETVLHSFSGSATDGSRPFSSLAIAKNGNLYGTTTATGTSSLGTVFVLY